MPKPTNLKQKNCESKSASCVYYDGPDIQDLDICNGDCITEVVDKLADGYIALKAITDIVNYPTQCLTGNITDFKSLINSLITKACL